MKPCNRFLLRISAAGFMALLMAMAGRAQVYSQARIVRLSFVEGDVTVQRPDVQGWAEAPVNTPLQEGFKISTGESSFAEVQFEEGGAIRLGEMGLIDFKQLGMAPNGSRINRLELREGYSTFHLLSSSLEESLQVETPYGTLSCQGEAKFRVDLDEGVQRVEVFSGAVQVESNLGGITVEQDSVLLIQPGASQPTVVSQGITEDDWDQWVENRDALMASSPAVPPPSDDAD